MSCQRCAAPLPEVREFAALCAACAEADSPADPPCEHDEHECGICNDCGAEVDWVSRVFRESDE